MTTIVRPYEIARVTTPPTDPVEDQPRYDDQSTSQTLLQKKSSTRLFHKPQNTPMPYNDAIQASFRPFTQPSSLIAPAPPSHPAYSPSLAKFDFMLQDHHDSNAPEEHLDSTQRIGLGIVDEIVDTDQYAPENVDNTWPANGDISQSQIDCKEYEEPMAGVSPLQQIKLPLKAKRKTNPRIASVSSITCDSFTSSHSNHRRLVENSHSAGLVFYDNPHISQTATGAQRSSRQAQHIGPPPSVRETRESFRSGITNTSSPSNTVMTERSSVLTRETTPTEIIGDCLSRPISKCDNDFTVDAAIEMYVAGFEDDNADARLNDSNRFRPTRSETAQYKTDKLNGSDYARSPAMLALTRSLSSQSSTMLHSPHSLPHPLSPPKTSKRDQYGFLKASEHVDIEAYDSWIAQHELVQERRSQKWVALLRTEGLPTDNPQKFPAPSPKTSRYIRKGIPPTWRGEAWFHYAGGQAYLDSEPYLYDDLVQRCDKQLPANERESIERDLYRTFPDNVFYRPNTNLASSQQPETPLLLSLRCLLQAFALHKPEIGYCQSLNYIGGLLLLFLPEVKAFWMLHIITTHYMPHTHDTSIEGAHIDLWVLKLALKTGLPGVWAKVRGDDDITSTAHNQVSAEDNGKTEGEKSKMGKARSVRRVASRNMFKKSRDPCHPDVNAKESSKADDSQSRTDTMPQIILCTTKWFMCLFIGTLPIETTLRIWDMLFYEGPQVIFRASLTIFKLLGLEMQRLHQLKNKSSLGIGFKGLGKKRQGLDKKHAEFYAALGSSEFSPEIFLLLQSLAGSMLDVQAFVDLLTCNTNQSVSSRKSGNASALSNDAREAAGPTNEWVNRLRAERRAWYAEEALRSADAANIAADIDTRPRIHSNVGSYVNLPITQLPAHAGLNPQSLPSIRPQALTRTMTLPTHAFLGETGIPIRSTYGEVVSPGVPVRPVTSTGFGPSMSSRVGASEDIHTSSKKPTDWDERPTTSTSTTSFFHDNDDDDDDDNTRGKKRSLRRKASFWRRKRL